MNQCTYLWHYSLWSFKSRDTKLERFLHKNQHSQRKLLNFENLAIGTSVACKNQSFQSWLFWFFMKKLKTLCELDDIPATFRVFGIFWVFFIFFPLKLAYFWTESSGCFSTHFVLLISILAQANLKKEDPSSPVLICYVGMNPNYFMH